MTDVAAPAALGWDLPLVAADAHKALRLRDAGDIDTDRINHAAVQASELLDAEVDAAETFSVTAASALHRAAVDLAIVLYLEPGLPDPAARVRAIAGPSKQRWGVA